MRKLMCALGAMIGASIVSASAETLKVVNWNVEAGSVENVLKRQAGIAQVPEGETPDILILQEINSFAAANLIAQAMGMTNFHAVTSDFGDDDDFFFFGLETAVISRVPIANVTEYQQPFDGKLDPNGPIVTTPDGAVAIMRNAIMPLEVPTDIITNQEDQAERITRGLLRVQLDNGLVIYPVHMKSNRTRLCGDIDDVNRVFSDLRRIGETVPEAADRVAAADTALQRLLRTKVNGEPNEEGSINSVSVQEQLPAIAKSHRLTAASRENTAAALMKLIAADMTNPQVNAVLVAGDFNTPLNEPSKTGQDLSVDCMPERLRCQPRKVENTCGTEDGFDDTHHILQSGVVDNVRLTAQLNDDEPTYVSDDEDRFAPSPIDTIYTAGKITIVRPAKRVKGSGEIAFGSDHFPIQIHISVNE